MKHVNELIYTLAMLVIGVMCIAVMIVVTAILGLWWLILPFLGLYVVAFIMEGVRNSGKNGKR